MPRVAGIRSIGVNPVVRSGQWNLVFPSRNGSDMSVFGVLFRQSSLAYQLTSFQGEFLCSESSLV